MSIQRAQKLIVILELLGVRIPKHINNVTVKAYITQSVHVAARRLTSKSPQPESNSTHPVLQALMLALMPGVSPTEERAKEVINLLLRALVDETKELIQNDREDVAKFGKVHSLTSWWQETLAGASSLRTRSCRWYLVGNALSLRIKHTH
jgi:hypothetical protein